MPLPLAQQAAVRDLAKFLNPFLPGTPHPYADRSISFEGVAKSSGLERLWRGGNKEPAISSLLTDTLSYDSAKFCPLITSIVSKAMLYKTGLAREDVETLNQLVLRIGFKIPELWDSKFLVSLPSKKERSGVISPEITKNSLEKLNGQLQEMTTLDPQARGFKFERFLNDLFEVFQLAPRASFRLVGEQIDGSIQFQGETYLIEAKWQVGKIDASELRNFSAKVDSKATWSRGLFVAYGEFSPDGLAAFANGRRTNIICMDALDLYYVLSAKLSLQDVLELKVRRATEENRAFVPVRELFPKETGNIV